MQTNAITKPRPRRTGRLAALLMVLALAVATLAGAFTPAPAYAAAEGDLQDVATAVTPQELEELNWNTSDYTLNGFTQNGTVEDMELNKTYSIYYKDAIDYFGKTLDVKVEVVFIENKMTNNNAFTRILVQLSYYLPAVDWNGANRSKVRFTITTIDPDTGESYGTNLVTGIFDPDESNYLFDTTSAELYYLPAEPTSGSSDDSLPFGEAFKVRPDGIYIYNPNNDNIGVGYDHGLILVAMNGSSSFSFVTDTFNAGSVAVPYWYKITKPFKVNYVLNGGTNASDNPTEYTSGDEKTIKDPTRDGYTFKGWTRKDVDDPTAGENSKIVKSDLGDKTFVAEWEPNYTIKYDANGGTGTMDAQEFKGSDTEMKSKENEFTREGYNFTGFKVLDKDGNPAKDENGEEYPVFSDAKDFVKYFEGKDGGESLTLQAQWEKTYTVTFEDGAHGKSDGGDETGKALGSKPSGGNTVTPDKGWEFSGTYTYVITKDDGTTEEGSTTDPTSVTITGNVVFTPTYNPIVTATSGKGGAISDPGDTTVDNGSSKTYTFTPEPGYKPGKVTVNGEEVTPVDNGDGTWSYTLTNVTEPTTIDVQWEKIPETYWVTYVDPDGQTIYLERTMQPVGNDEPAAPATPTREGYTFDGWDRTVDEDGNITYIARWRQVNTPAPDPEPDPDPAPAPQPTPTPQPRTAASSQIPAATSAPAATPKTADPTPIGALATLALASAAVCMTALGARRRSKEEEAD